MDRLTAIEIFVEVARAGSFAAVADRFAMTPAMIGKYIKWLEARVGSRLLNRNTRCQSLTEAGQEYLAAARTCCNTTGSWSRTPWPIPARRRAGSASMPRHLRQLPADAAAVPLHGALPADPHRAGSVGSLVDVIGDGFDLIFRVGQPKDAGYIARPLASSDSVFCASPHYLQRHGIPLTLADLARHHCLGFSPWLGQSSLAEAFPLEQLHLWDSPSSATTAAPQGGRPQPCRHPAAAARPAERGARTRHPAGDPGGCPARPAPGQPALSGQGALPLRLRLLIDYLSEQRHQL